MHRLAAALAVLSLPALAQVDLDLDHDVEETTVQVPGVQVKVRTRGPGLLDPEPVTAPPPAPQHQPPPRVVGAEAFSIDYAPVGVPAATIKVLSPEGALAEVWSDAGHLEGRFTVPFNFKGRGNTWYRFILVGADGLALFDRKLEVKQFLGGTLRFRGAAVVAPSPAPMAAGMPAHDFAALVAAVNDAAFSEEKLGVISTAAQSHVFTVEQVGALVDALSHSSEKVKAVELTRHRLVDRHNGFKLLSHFSFSGDKQKVQQLLK